MTLFGPAGPDHRQPLPSKRAIGVVYFLGVVVMVIGVLYLMGFLMGD
jgi:hypothetical protein